MSNSYLSEEYRDAVDVRHIYKRKILHPTNDHRKWADEYCAQWKRTTPFPKKYSKEGQADFYKRVIIGRLQNRTLKELAEENGRSTERIRQIFCRFSRWAANPKRGYDLKRPLMERVYPKNYGKGTSQGLSQKTCGERVIAMTHRHIFWTVRHKETGDFGDKLFQNYQEAINFCNFPSCYYEICRVEIRTIEPCKECGKDVCGCELRKLYKGGI